MYKNLDKCVVCICVGIVLSLSNCTYNSEEDLYPTPMDGCATEDMSYTTDVLPIIETNCYGCHDAENNNAGINLEGHANLVVRINDGSLLGSMRHEEGWSAMPAGAPKLGDCQLEKISAWADQGALNN